MPQSRKPQNEREYQLLFTEGRKNYGFFFYFAARWIVNLLKLNHREKKNTEHKKTSTQANERQFISRNNGTKRTTTKNNNPMKSKKKTNEKCETVSLLLYAPKIKYVK